MWETLSKILNIVLGVSAVCLYFENRKLKKYDAEKDLKRREASLEKLIADYKNYSGDLLARFGAGVGAGEEEKKESEFKYREKCLNAEIEYLEKVLKIKK